MNPIIKVTIIIAPICPEETPRTIPNNINPPTITTIQRIARNNVSIRRPSVIDYTIPLR
jgi:hypothetical protein